MGLLEANGCADRDDHPGIPRDGGGLPIYFILPPGVQKSYVERLARCEHGWRQTRNPGFVKEAQVWTHLHRQPPALWLSEAVIALAERRQGKGHATSIFNAAIRLMRYRAVVTAPPPRRCCDLETGRVVTWKDVYKHAARGLANTQARGKPSTIKRDYHRVKRDFKQGRGALYRTPLPTYRKLSDVVASDPDEFVPRSVSKNNLGETSKRKPSPG